ncbi:MAG TPA: FlgD immunoglobulin-like domain containing protein [Candidatus Krumholzibacteriaceae bacterium]|nr:FlgD immunoglobulin-like domain containing protein [Candidatus Krumholzibacteriaceae bacterium]
MKKDLGIWLAAIVLVFSLLPALPCFAGNNVYTENFSTSLYEDPAYTTANWDTVAGELKFFTFQPTLTGSYNTSGIARDVKVSGDYAFVADNDNGIQVFDISDTANPLLIGSYGAESYTLDVEVSGDNAFLADYSSGLQILDISDPTTPLFVGAYNTSGTCQSVYVEGDYAFIADGDPGLIIIDISDPSSPALLGTYNSPGYARNLTVSGDYAFIADGLSGLRVIDISDPANPTSLGSYDTAGDAREVRVSGDYALVADNTSGLQVVDISDPSSPALLGTCDTPGHAYGVIASGDYAFVADYNYGVQVIDISDPSNPQIIGSYDTPVNTYGVTVSGENVFLADAAGGLKVVKIAQLVNPKLVGNYDTSSYCRHVTVSGDFAFVADYRGGLRVIDISDSANPALLGTYDTPGYAHGVAVSGDYAFVADGGSGLQMIDISDPANPVFLENFNTAGYATDVAVSGDCAFLADGGMLYLIDISDRSNLTSLGTYSPLLGNVRGVEVSGNCAFVADGDWGLLMIDITDPTSPTSIGRYYQASNNFMDVTCAGDYAFAANDTSGLYVIDISDPHIPSLLGSCNTPGSAVSVEISGNYAFVADADSGLHVINISDPTSPTLIATCDTPDYAYGVAVAGDYAYVADGSSGLQSVVVSQGKLDLDGNVGRSLFVDASGDTIFRTRLTSTYTDSVDWEVSADGGTNWQEILPDGEWNKQAVPGKNLLWRSTLLWEEPGDNPAVTELQLEWLVGAGVISEIVDVPDDQGGWVQMNIIRSGKDFLDETDYTILEYKIWRWDGDVDDGEWVCMDSVTAAQQDEYVVTLPTVKDSCASSTNHTTFLVTAHTTKPTLVFACEPDSGYSIDNIAPSVPTNFSVVYNTGSGNHLSWDPCPDGDFKQFNVYRSNDPGFIPSPSDLVCAETGTSWYDPEYDGWDVFYKITALDSADNESDPVSPSNVTATEDPEIPRNYVLYPNVPNPFNPITSIRYDVPAEGGIVTLRIYDVSGRLIRTVLNGPQTSGQKTVTWNGRDSRGLNVASGVYFYRLTAPGYKKTLRMVLLR